MGMDVCFIMVEPAVPGNVGSAARAIKTMGFNKLYLVNPCDHLSIESKMLAHASIEILEEAKIFSSLTDALSGIDLSIATTAKNRNARLEYQNNIELPGIIRSKGDTVRSIALVFGGEESGLSNGEIQLCDISSTIPLKQKYPSLNLAQAVMIYAYTLAELSKPEDTERVSPARENEFRIMMDKSKHLLGNLGIDASPALYNRILERIALLKEDDIHLLLSVLGRLE